MRIVVALAIAATLAWLLVSTHGNNCHFNVHLKKRLICTEQGR
jgi:hypothetical protein